MSEYVYMADGKWIKGLFPFFETWPWILRSLEDYITNEQPWQIIHWFIIDKNDNLKIYTKIHNVMQNSIQDSLLTMIEDSRVKYIVGPISKYYDMEYFIKYLTDSKIEFKKELNSEGAWILFM